MTRFLASIFATMLLACGGSTASTAPDASGTAPPMEASVEAPDTGASAPRVDSGRRGTSDDAGDAGTPSTDGGACGYACALAHPQGESGALLGLYDCMTSTACQTKCQSAVQQRQWTADCMHCVQTELDAGHCESHCSNQDDECLAFQTCVASCP